MRDIKTKKSKGAYVLFGAIFCVVYIILSARPLGGEWQLLPQWRLDINNSTIVGVASDDADAAVALADSVPFKLGQSMGYFTPDGQLLLLLSFPFKASISPTRYVRYGADSTNIPFYNRDGTEGGILQGSGFPLFEDERIYMFAPGGASFAQMASDGHVLWRYGGTVPITAFDSSDAACVAGFADGSVKEFTPEGHITQEFSPGGSNISVILGAGVSHSGDMLASVSGQDRQRFVLAKRSGAGSRIVFHEYVSGDVHQRLVQFTADDSVVYYDTQGELGAVDTRSMRHSHIPIEGQAVSMKECGTLRFVLTRSVAEEGASGGVKVYTVYIIEKFDTVVGSFNFTAHNAFIRTDKNSLYVGRDNAISRMTVEKK